MSIEVGGGPIHNRIDANLIGECIRAWDRFVSELESVNHEHGVNNNELKERASRLKVAIDALYLNVRLLPPQGRRVSFTATTTTSMSEIIRCARGV